MVDVTAADEARNEDPVALGNFYLRPGWHTERVQDRLVSRRLERLSDYQLGRGCLEEITATSVTELVILCDVQNQLGHRVALAEQVARDLGEASP